MPRSFKRRDSRELPAATKLKLSNRFNLLARSNSYDSSDSDVRPRLRSARNVKSLNLQYTPDSVSALSDRSSTVEEHVPPISALQSDQQTPPGTGEDEPSWFATKAEALAATSAEVAALAPSPFDKAATAASAFSLIASGVPGIRNFVRKPSLGNAFSAANIIAGVNTYLPPWRYANFVSASLTAIGAMPSLFAGVSRGLSGAAGSTRAAALYTASGMAYGLGAALQYYGAEHSTRDDPLHAYYGHLSSAAWGAAIVTNVLAQRVESARHAELAQRAISALRAQAGAGRDAQSNQPLSSSASNHFPLLERESAV